MTDTIFHLDRRGLIQAGLAGTLAASPAMAMAAGKAPAPASPRRTLRLSDGWRFHLGHATDIARDFGYGRNQRTFAKAGTGTADAAMPAFKDEDWQDVRVPHDWAVDLPYAPPLTPAGKDDEDAVAAHGFRAIGRAFPENSVGWYRRALPVSAADKGRSVWLEFDGVMRDSVVFINGYIVGGSASGYAPFRVDISDFLDYDGGPNVLALRVDASLGEGWYYEGAGIYRNVTLVSAAQAHVPQWGVCVRSTVAGVNADLEITMRLANGGDAPLSATLRQSVIGPDGTTVATIAEARFDIPAKSDVEWAGHAPVAAPRLWSVEHPDLYRLISEVLVDGAVVDRTETTFGIRTAVFDAERGFLLNGKVVKLLGVCNHQEHAGVGTAIPDALHAWRVAQTQSMGSNAWRSAHNPVSQSLLDICDQAGMLMIAEARLNSTSPEAMDELDRMILSSRNHPSIIAWSLGNEEPQQVTARGAHITASMRAHAKKLDPTRATTQAFDNGWGVGASMEVDVIGFNYRTDKIADFHKRFPHIPVIGTETGSTVSTRGAYANDAARHIVRAYDTEHPWWASTAEEWWKIVADAPYIGGGFIWTGFDYRGEPTPFPSWPSVSSYFGAMDMCGFPKDNYWYYRSWWRAEKLVHLLPHWNWPGREGQEIEVWVHGNCAQVELFLNGKSLGRKDMPRNGHLEWKVPYQPGTLEARGIEQGRIVAQDRQVTPGAAAAVRLVTDRTRLNADGNDLAMLRAEVVDAKGHPVATADNLLHVSISGPARLIGVGNGDPTSHEPDHAPTRHAFNGLAQAIVQTTGQAGRIVVSVGGEGLSGAQIELFAHGDA